MKRYLLIFAMLLGAAGAWGQSANDQAAVLQKIVDLPDLQQYYPMDAVQNRSQVFVVKSVVQFPANLQLAKFGKPVSFIDSADILKGQSVAYFVFNTFTIDGNSAHATFNFYYTYTTKQSIFECSVVLNKSGDSWAISESKLSRK
jgi:hypothetical protein